MKIGVFGLGYVGTVTASCLADSGHEIVGVDISATKVSSINAGRSPVVEAHIDGLTEAAVRSGRLRATLSTDVAVSGSDISLICVGTPSNGNGSLDLSYVKACCHDIGRALRNREGFHIVAVRSTVLPGSIRDTVKPILEESSKKKAGVDFGLCSNPEFLREGTSVDDFLNPPFTLIGSSDAQVACVMARLYERIQAPLIQTSIEVAEIVKYVNNAFHALKICFANEVGNICKGLGIDSHEVMDIFCRDHKLNLSSYYLKPGFAFGGSCLPKDVRAITYLAKSMDIATPALNSILPSNEQQLKIAIGSVTTFGKKRIGLYGLSFKAGTDDLRESPTVLLAEYLLGKGYKLNIYDRNVTLSNILGANRDFIEREIPHIEGLLTKSLDEFINFAEVVVVSQRPPVEDAYKFDGKTVVDLVRMPAEARNGHYYGLCW